MSQYDINVGKVMGYLKEHNYSPSSKSLHKICYERFNDYLRGNKLSYSSEYADGWLESSKDCWNYRQYTGYKHCLRQLEDIFRNGQISLVHVAPQVSNNSLLCDTLKAEINEYLDYALSIGVKESDIPRRRIACSRFMVYLQKHNIKTISDISYDIILSFYREDYHRTYKSKDVYDNLINAMLIYLSSVGKCHIGHALILNKLLIHQVILNADFVPDSMKELKIKPDLNIWATINDFLGRLQEIQYGATVIKSSRHTLTLLYIFLDMYDLSFAGELIWLWFNEMKPLLKTNWKQARRTLNQFIYFMDQGTVILKMTGDNNAKLSIDLLPSWCQKPLKDFLTLKKREGKAKSTLDMYHSSIVRFCIFIINNGIFYFNGITPLILQNFNTQDPHSSTEGKSAYNSRIRSFIIYLNEQKLIDNCFLYKALPTITAPKTKIINILEQEEIATIHSFHIEHNSDIELRDNAILMVGLNLGLRASDIVSLKFSNIDWSNRSISIIQQKTGKDITLPMPVVVGNAIYQYIKWGRPKSDCSHIFIRHTVPYSQLTSTVCRHALQRILPDRKAPGSGFHIVRKTFATNLLRGNSKVTLISDILGHRTEGSVIKYLSLDKERMQMCPLSLCATNIPWMGGSF